MVAYTRQNEADIADGLVIEAADLNAEFDAILAFCQAPTVGAGAAGADISLTFDGESADGVITWMEDEDHFKFMDDVLLDTSKRLYLYDEGGEYIYGDGTDLYLVSGADINIPANIGMTFGNDGEKIEGDGTDLTISGNNINLTATADVVIPANVGITFGTGEKIEGDSTDLTVTSGAKINLTATSDVIIPSGVGLILDGSGNEKIESDGTDISVSVGSGGDINIPADIGVTFGDDGEKIEGDGTNLTISTSNNVTVDAAADIILDAGGADVTLKDDGTTFGSLTNSGGELVVKSGSTPTTAMTFSGANVTFGGTVTIGSAGISEAELEILDGATVTTTELNLIDGDTARGTTAVASGDGLLVNDAGTMRMTNVDTVSTYFASHNVGGSNIVTTGALDSGSITSGFGAIDNGTSGIRTNTFTAETSIIPDASGGADIGSTSAEWGDIYVADDKYVQFGSDQNVIVGYDENGNDSLEFKANVEAAALALTFSADQADDNADTWKLNFADGGTITWQSYTSGSFATKLTLDTSGNVTVAGDLTVSGDDITMGTNTSGAALIADGTNFNPVVISGDATIATNGALTIANDAVENAMIADNAIDSEHYTDGSIDNAHIADDAIDSEHYAAGSIDTAHIAHDQVTLAKMAGLARGKIIYGDSSGNPAALAVGSNTYVLKSDGTDISWGAQSVSSLAADDISAGDAAVTLSTTSGNITVDATANDSDIIFKGTDATSDITMLTLDGSEAGKAIFNAGITIADAGTIGSASDADSIAISSTGVVTMNQIPVFSAGINVSGGSIAGTLSTAAQGNVTSLGTLTDLTVDDVNIGAKVITMTGSASDTAVFTAGTHGTLSIVTTDAAAAAANIQITADGTVDIDSAGVLTLDSGAAINIEPASGSAILLDGTISVDAGVVTGATSITSTAFVGDITGDVTGNTSGSAATVTTAAQTNITSLGTLTALTVDDVAVNGKVITMTGSASDTAVFTAGTHGTLDITTTDAAAAAANISITADGTFEVDATTITLDSAGDIILDAAGNNVIFKSGGTSILDFSNSSSDAVITSSVQDKDIIFKGDDGGSAITALTMDMSAAGKSIFGAAAVGATDTDTSNSGSITLDFDAEQNFVLTATGNITLANPTTESIGQSGVIVLIQDGTGSRTLSTGTNFEWPAGAVGTISTAGGAIDVIPYFVDAADSILLGAPQLAFSTPS